MYDRDPEPCTHAQALHGVHCRAALSSAQGPGGVHVPATDEVQTPHLNQLVREGIELNRACDFCQLSFRSKLVAPFDAKGHAMLADRTARCLACLACRRYVYKYCSPTRSALQFELGCIFFITLGCGLQTL